MAGRKMNHTDEDHIVPTSKNDADTNRICVVAPSVILSIAVIAIVFGNVGIHWYIVRFVPEVPDYSLPLVGLGFAGLVLILTNPKTLRQWVIVAIGAVFASMLGNVGEVLGLFASQSGTFKDANAVLQFAARWGPPIVIVLLGALLINSTLRRLGVMLHADRSIYRKISDRQPPSIRP